MRALASFVVVLAFALAACDAPPGPAPAAGPGHAHEHVHRAPHGGSLVVLAEEALNAELLVDVATGRMDLWVLDGECEGAVTIAQPEVALTVTVGGTARTIRLAAVEDALTGEKAGATSHFAGTDDALRGASKFHGTIQSLKVGARAFQAVPFEYALSSR